MIIKKLIKTYDIKCSTQTKTLSNAIYKQKEMIKQLSHVSNKIQEMNNMKLINHLQAELHAVSKSEIRLEMFENEKNINKLNIFVLIKHMQKIAFKL